MMDNNDITFETLDELGFEKWNDCFTYRGFPAPLYGNYRIDKDDDGRWRIYHGYKNETYLHPQNMTDVMKFFLDTKKLIET